MIRRYSKDVRELLTRRDLFSLAAALLLALAAYYFLLNLVEGLVTPAIAAIFGKRGLYELYFTINEAQFNYGSVLTGLILLASAVILVVLVAKLRRPSGGGSTGA
jgi:large conductance mechanosensitive channel